MKNTEKPDSTTTAVYDSLEPMPAAESTINSVTPLSNNVDTDNTEQNKDFSYVSSPSKNIWNLVNPKELSQFSGHEKEVKALAFSPDGTTLASAGVDKTIKLWNVSTQSETAAFAAHKLAINALAFSPDGTTLASAGADKTIKLWNVSTQSETAVFAHKLATNALAFSPDGTTLASAGADNKIRLWLLIDVTELIAISTPTWQIGCTGISTNGQVFANCTENNEIRLWQF